jgi:hypothetical protein
MRVVTEPVRGVSWAPQHRMKQESKKYIATIKPAVGGTTAIITLTLIGCRIRNDNCENSTMKTLEDAIQYLLPERYSLISIKRV